MNNDSKFPWDVNDEEWAEICARARDAEWEEHVQSMFDMLAGAE